MSKKSSWINLGTKVSANNSGRHHENVQIKVNSQGKITDILRAPVSNNPNKTHDHHYKLNTNKPGTVRRGKYD